MANTYFCDSETLGQYDNSIILSIAFLKEPENSENWNYKNIKNNKKEFFNEIKKNSLYIEIDKKEQAEAGRGVTKSTLEWWAKQGEEAKKVLRQEKAVSMMTAYKKIFEYFAKHNISKKDVVFSRRCFENKLWQHFCEVTLKQPTILEFYQWRDSSTLVWLLQDDFKFDFQKFPDLGLVTHNALSDCIIDFIKMKELGL
jgi:hypothetical protein